MSGPAHVPLPQPPVYRARAEHRPAALSAPGSEKCNAAKNYPWDVGGYAVPPARAILADGPASTGHRHVSH